MAPRGECELTAGLYAEQYTRRDRPVDYEIEIDGIDFRLQNITDGLSNTFLLGEDQPSKNRWLSWPYSNGPYGTCAVPPNVKKPDGTEYNPLFWHYTWSFRSAHLGGLHFAFADGSVRWIRNDIDMSIYRGLATIRGNERAAAPEE